MAIKIYRPGNEDWRTLYPDLSPEEQLTLAKEQLHEERRTRRVAAETGGFNFTEGGEYYVVASDRDSLQRITGASISAILALMSGATWGTVWACEDYRLCPVDAAGMSRMLAALVQHGLACHTRSEELKNQINSATTLDEVAAIKFETGWPSPR